MSKDLPSPIDPDNLSAITSFEQLVDKYNDLLYFIAEQNNQRWDGWDWVYIKPVKEGGDESQH